MIIKSRNKFHLSRRLHAQTTPYPGAKKWLRRGIFASIMLILLGIYIFSRPNGGAVSQDADLAPKQILGEQETAAEQEFETYQIKNGDTLFNIAARFDISWGDLAEHNNLQEPYILRINQEIKIPRR